MIPKNEMELIIVFSQVCQQYGFKIVKAQAEFPDAIIRYKDIEYKVEFEFKSSNFWMHKHNPTECDLIICWEDDDEYSILPIIALSNPNWFEDAIVLSPYNHKLVGYWKRRALAAEGKLNIIENDARVIYDESLQKYAPSLAERLVIDLLREGKSYRQISREAWGGVGSFYNRRIETIADKWIGLLGNKE